MPDVNKILYDYQILRVQKYGGISRYFYELAIRIKDRNRVKVPCLLSRNEYFQAYYKKQKNKLSCVPKTGRIIRWFNKLYTCLMVKFFRPDIIHPTYYSPYILKCKGKSKLIVTVHDMIHELFSEHIEPSGKVRLQKKQMVASADKIIAVSQCTKNDLIKILHVPPEKIEVVYHGTPLVNRGKKVLLPSKYLLFVGGRWYYKNFTRFIEAVAPILQQEKDLYLICTGGGSFSDKEKEMIKNAHLTDKVQQLNLSDEELFYTYERALCFVFPSLYEGFGLPVLEAMACHCPVLLSNTSSLPEVGGDAALYFDPHSATSIRKTVQKVAQSEQVRKEMIQKGSEQVKKFSWDKCTKQTLEVYKKVLQEHK